MIAVELLSSQARGAVDDAEQVAEFERIVVAR
jgi:hypothetical protein